MTQVFAQDGTVIPVTKVLVEPCLIVHKKTVEKDGYRAIACATSVTKKANKPARGLFKKFGDTNYHTIQEFRFDDKDGMYDALNEGDVIDATALVAGDMVEVVSVGKGKGQAGVVKLHHFRGGPKSHGHKDQLRHSGTVGAKGVAHIFKGTRMAGRMGGKPVTIRGLEIVAVDAEKQIVYVKGAIAGARHTLVSMTAVGDFAPVSKQTKPVEAPAMEAPAVEAVVVAAETVSAQQ